MKLKSIWLLIRYIPICMIKGHWHIGKNVPYCLRCSKEID